MIDPKVLRTDPDRLRRSQLARGESVELVDDALAADETRRSSISAFEAARAEQKSLGALVARAKGDEKAELLARTKELSGQVKALSADVDQAGVAFDAVMKRFGNLVIDGVPTGGEDDLYVVETVGTPRDFAAEGITVRDHLEIGEIIGAIDMERGAKVSGSRFYFLTGPGALLEFALMQHALAKALEWELPADDPAGAGQAERDGGHRIPWSGGRGRLPPGARRLYLVGTAEVPLAAYHSDEILDAGSLPLRYASQPGLPAQGGQATAEHPRHLRVHWSTSSRCSSTAVPRTPRPSTNACWVTSGS